MVFFSVLASVLSYPELTLNSNAQRGPELNYIRTVYNGIDPQDYPFKAQPEDPPYLAFLGRLSPEKGPQHAIAIALQTGSRLKMAGKIDVVDRQFFEQEIAPSINRRHYWTALFELDANHQEISASPLNSSDDGVL